MACTHRSRPGESCRAWVVWVVTGGLAASAFAGTACAASFTGLGDLPGGRFDSKAYGISGDGSVVVGTGAGASGVSEAFRWTAATGMVSLDTGSDGTRFFSAEAVSADGGTAVGRVRSMWDEASGTNYLSALDGVPASASAAHLSADGSVLVGSYEDDQGLDLAFHYDALGGFAPLGELPGGSGRSDAYGVSPNGQWVTGSTRPSGTGTYQAFLWHTDTGMVQIGERTPLYPWSWGARVTDDGALVVGTRESLGFDSYDRREAFTWTAETGVVGLGGLSGEGGFSVAADMSNDGGNIVGHSVDDAGDRFAVFWDASRDIHRVDAYLAAMGLGEALEGWHLWEAEGVSSDGTTLVGWGTNPDGQREAWIASLTDTLPGDYTGEGTVDQDDLDLVLTNWGGNAPTVPLGWAQNWPIGAVDQGELDDVLQNWGAASQPNLNGLPVPEPAAAGWVVLAWGASRGRCRRQRRAVRIGR